MITQKTGTPIYPEKNKSQQDLIKSCKIYFPGIIAAVFLFFYGSNLNIVWQSGLTSIFLYSVILGTKHFMFGFRSHLISNIELKRLSKPKHIQINGAIETMKVFHQNLAVFNTYQLLDSLNNSSHKKQNLGKYDSLVKNIADVDSDILLKASHKLEAINKLSGEFNDMDRRRLVLSDERRLKILEAINEIGFYSLTNYPGLLELICICMNSIREESAPEVLIKLIELSTDFLINLIIEENMRIECIHTIHSQTLSNVLKADSSLFPNEAEILRGDMCKKTALDLGFILKKIQIIIKQIKAAKASSASDVRQAAGYSLYQLSKAFRTIDHGRLKNVSYELIDFL